MIHYSNSAYQLNKTVVVNVAEPVRPAQVPAPAITRISATNTDELLRNMGKEVEVEGTISLIDYQSPANYPAERWLFILFNSSEEGRIPGSLANRNWFDYISNFRIIITKEYIRLFDNYQSMYPYPGKQWALNYLRYSDQVGNEVVVRGELAPYQAAPAIYLQSTAQIWKKQY